MKFFTERLETRSKIFRPKNKEYRVILLLFALLSCFTILQISLPKLWIYHLTVSVISVKGCQSFKFFFCFFYHTNFTKNCASVRKNFIREYKTKGVRFRGPKIKISKILFDCRMVSEFKILGPYFKTSFFFLENFKRRTCSLRKKWHFKSFPQQTWGKN